MPILRQKAIQKEAEVAFKMAQIMYRKGKQTSNIVSNLMKSPRQTTMNEIVQQPIHIE